MRKEYIYRTWGRPYGDTKAVICEMTAYSKKEAVEKLEANGVVVDDKKHVWKSAHGGVRMGAGRPKTKEDTVVMRVPVSLVEKVKKLIDKHRK